MKYAQEAIEKTLSQLNDAVVQIDREMSDGENGLKTLKDRRFRVNMQITELKETLDLIKQEKIAVAQ